jgi:hypothetical protein
VQRHNFAVKSNHCDFLSLFTHIMSPNTLSTPQILCPLLHRFRLCNYSQYILLDVLEKALYIPSGFYNHSNVVVVDSVVVFGDGESTIMYANSTEFSALQLVGNNSALYYMWVSGNPHLRDSGQPQWNLVWGFHAKNITVQNIRVSPMDGIGEARPSGENLGVWGTGGVFLYDVQGGLVADNHVEYVHFDLF